MFNFIKKPKKKDCKPIEIDSDGVEFDPQEILDEIKKLDADKLPPPHNMSIRV